MPTKTPRPPLSPTPTHTHPHTSTHAPKHTHTPTHTLVPSGHVHVWDTATRNMTHLAAVGFAPRTAAFSNAPIASTGTFHMAVGGAKGQIKVCRGGAV